MDGEVIDLVGSPRPERKRNKRRREHREPPPQAADTIELSDGDDEEEERLHAARPPFDMFAPGPGLPDLGGWLAGGGGRGGPPLAGFGRGFGGNHGLAGLAAGGGAHYGASFAHMLLGSHSLLPGGGYAGGGALAMDAAAAAASAAAHNLMGRHRAGGGGMAHLALLDRDFNEADYEMLLQLDEDKDGPEKKRALKQNGKLLDALPSKRLSKGEASRGEQTCAICLEAMRAGQTVLTLRCKHDYHRSCILKWLKSCEAPTCPCCKAPALGHADSPPTRESSPEQQWWHT